MPDTTRRRFIEATGSTAAIGMLSKKRPVHAAADDRPTIALIGCGGRAKGLLREFAKHSSIAWACDPDARRAAQFAKDAGSARTTADLRETLEDPSVDAVVIATPDHWHAPAAILACEAGKHVYVEKPQSHNLRESRLLLDAARRNNVVVQHGTQSRSSPLITGAIAMLHEGIIGDVLVAKAWNVQRRANIGHHQPGPPPAEVDYDLWVGPAEFMPYQENRFHYNWHWWHNFGTGDIGNDGTHELDMARWGLGVEGLPTTAMAIGGKYGIDDDQQFPDTATCAFEWPGDGSVGRRRQLVFEMRLWSRNYPFNCDSGVEFFGSAGRMLLSKRGKLEVYDDKNRRIENPSPKRPPDRIANHQLDFLDAIESGRRPNADVRDGHDSVCLVHLANIAVREASSLRIDPVREVIVDNNKAAGWLTRKYRDGGHWAIPKGAS